MTEAEEMGELIADVRAALDAALRCGATEEPADSTLPEVTVEEVVAASPPAIAEAPTPSPVAALAWAAAAEAARAEATPTWSQPLSADGHGAEGIARIREDLGDCRRCRLCVGRTHIAFGVGDPDADLMVIGEGPGEQEDLQGEPFVGPAGQMLDKMLANVVKLPRPRVYIANVVKCRPPDNRNPAAEEVAACLPFLERQIRAVAPKLLLVLGNVAMEHVLGNRGIKRARGHEVHWKGIPAIPTFHPAYLLRVPEDKRLAMEDLLLTSRRYDELGGRRP